MLGYAIRRILWIIPVVLGASFLAFTVMHAAPGSPWNREGRPLPAWLIERLNEQLGLDQPLPMQYLAWLGRMLTGDFGLSVSDRPSDLSAVVVGSLGPSAQLGLMAFGLALLIGIPLGLIAAIRHRTVVDYVATGISVLGMAAPAFVLAGILQLSFGLPEWRIERGEGLFPVGGWETPMHWVLPTLAMAGLPMAQIARFTRASMLEVMHAEYVRTAHAKGLQERHIVQFHLVRNAVIPLLTISGPILALMLTGSIVVERVFDIPGLGNLYWSSMRVRDYGTLMGITFLVATAFAVLNAAVDVAYGFIDPRIRDRSLRQP